MFFTESKHRSSSLLVTSISQLTLLVLVYGVLQGQVDRLSALKEMYKLPEHVPLFSTLWQLAARYWQESPQESKGENKDGKEGEPTEQAVQQEEQKAQKTKKRKQRDGQVDGKKFLSGVREWQ